MRTAVLSLALAAVLVSPSVFAQDMPPFTGEPAPARQKSVRDMTPDERRVYWETLPEEQKKRILERRQKIAAEAAQNNKWKNLSGKQPGTVSVTPPKTTTPLGQGGQKPWANDPNLSDEQKAAIERGAQMWNTMSPEQKKAFVLQHQGQINSAVQARQNSSTGYGQ